MFEYDEDEILDENKESADHLISMTIIPAIAEDFSYPEDEFADSDKLSILYYIIKKLEAEAKELEGEVNNELF